jgi:hypothetical protein
MAFQDNNNVVDTIIDTQKKVLDSVVENTKKFTSGNTILNETIEKGTDWYKNWLEDQKNLFTKATGAAAGTAETAKENTTNGNPAQDAVNGATAKMQDFYENWMNTQSNWAKQIWEMSQEAAKKFGAGATTNPFTSFTNGNANPFANWQNSWNNSGANANPFANWQNSWSTMNNPMSNWMNQMNTNNWMNQMQQMNPFNQDAFKKANENFTNTFTQYYTNLNNTFGDFQKNFQNGTVQDAFKNMANSAEGFTKFTEMWMPMFKSMQDKTFNMDTYKQFMNPELYKDFMDKFFGFLPESSRQQMQQMTSMMNDGMKQMSQNGMNGYNQMRDMMSKMGNGSQAFGDMHTAYTKWYGQMNEAAAPFTKMVTPNQQTKAIQEWAEIANRVSLYNIKNAELQYMIYTQGTKVMDKLAENVAKKIQDGTEVTSMLALYQEWLNISDKVYVSLFESTEYSELMAEVGAMQMKLRRDIELQTEKMLKDIPVATRSQLDEVYKTIYDLKKQVREMESKVETGATKATETAKEATEEKAAPAKNGKKA